jgi:hypothetical protein
MGPEVSLLWSQELTTTDPYPELYENSPHRNSLFLKDP